MKMIVITSAMIFALLTVATTIASAQTATMETVLDGLNNPTSIAIQPETGHVFVCDSGAKRVIRVIDGKAEEVVIGFDRDFYGQGPLYDIGPLSLLFLDKDHLVVGTGGLLDGEESISTYEVPAVGAKPLRADKIVGKAYRLKPEGDDIPGEGDFYGMVNTHKGVYVTCNGDDTQGWIGLAKLRRGRIISFQRSVATKLETKTNAPVAITNTPDGFMAIGLMGATKGKRDSKLIYCDPEDGEIVDIFNTGMFDVTGLAYGPKQGRLFATDFNWSDPEHGALVKLVETAEGGCKSLKVMNLEKPTSLMFSSEGDLYITLAGNSSEGVEKPDGKLVVIKGLDRAPNKATKK